MKTLKAKILNELNGIEQREALSVNPIGRNTIEDVCKLSKALYYLERAEGQSAK